MENRYGAMNALASILLWSSTGEAGMTSPAAAHYLQLKSSF